MSPCRSRPRASRRSSSLIATRRETFMAGMERKPGQRRACMAQLRKARKQVRPRSVVRGPPRVELAASREVGVPLAEPVQEGGRVLDLLGGEPADARCDVAPLSAGPQPGENAPGRVELDHLGVLGVGDAGQMPGKPALEGTKVLVGRRKDSARHQEFSAAAAAAALGHVPGPDAAPPLLAPARWTPPFRHPPSLASGARKPHPMRESGKSAGQPSIRVTQLATAS